MILICIKVVFFSVIWENVLLCKLKEDKIFFDGVLLFIWEEDCFDIIEILVFCLKYYFK